MDAVGVCVQVLFAFTHVAIVPIVAASADGMNVPFP